LHLGCRSRDCPCEKEESKGAEGKPYPAQRPGYVLLELFQE